jgi:hypothetical protein
MVGLAMVATTLVRGGGLLAVGVLMGTLFAVLGAARLWLTRGAGVPPARRDA